MKILVIKTGASGDVMRTTILLELLREHEIHWYTTTRNACLVNGKKILTRPEDADGHYDWIINLEEDPAIFDFINELSANQYTGPYTGKDGVVYYQPVPNEWFDMSRISRFGPEKADRLKLENRKTYQEMLCNMIGMQFNGERYYAPPYDPKDRECSGTIGIVISDSSHWPTKNWTHLKQLGEWLVDVGYSVNFLKRRNTIQQHIADVTGHEVIVCGDSLPMHICIAHKIPCVTLFTCTSPWEIEGYGLLNKVVSPKLHLHYYKPGLNEEVASSIDNWNVINAITERLKYARSTNNSLHRNI